MTTVVLKVLQMLVMTLSVMVAVGFFSMVERKVLSFIQYRNGPNKVLVSGVGQPLSDAIKLIVKQASLPSSSMKLIYIVIPPILFSMVMAAWVFLWDFKMIETDLSIVCILAILGLTVFGPVFAGWSANSMYSVIGSFRAIAQTLSFEIVMSTSIISFSILQQNLNPSSQSYMLMGLIMPIPLMGVVSAMVAESGRAPFDLPEGESELVGGYSVDYGGSLYKMVFLMENVSILCGGGIISYTCFPPMTWLKCVCFAMIVCVIRAAVPRMRYDSMMVICWTFILPLIITFIAIASTLG